MVDKINCYILVLVLVISDYKILDGKFYLILDYYVKI